MYSCKGADAVRTRLFIFFLAFLSSSHVTFVVPSAIGDPNSCSRRFSLDVGFFGEVFRTIYMLLHILSLFMLFEGAFVTKMEIQCARRPFCLAFQWLKLSLSPMPSPCFPHPSHHD